MLTQAAAVRYLLGRGLISSRVIVEGDLVVSDASSRHQNFKVISDAGPCYLLKQGFGPQKAADVAREGLVYEALSAQPGTRSYLCEFDGYDPREQVLILELIPDAVDLRAYHLRRRRPSVRVAAAVGEALGSLHSIPVTRSGRAFLPEWPAGILSLHRPDLTIFRDASAASLELIKIVQNTPGFGEHLDDLCRSWRPETVVHNDIKWDNVIVVPSTVAAGRPRLKLVDWESAGRGDPRWDIGSALAHYLSFWVFSIPVTGAAPPHGFAALARRPLTSMQPAIRACWQAYVSRLGLDEATADMRLRDAVRFSAARLVQTAFEAAQVSTELTSGMTLHLQLSINMLQRPREAAVHLLGLRQPADLG